MFRRGVTLGQRLRLAIQDRGLEWLSAGVMVWWGIALASPGDTLTGPAFSAFHRYEWMTETFWAAAFGLVGGGRIVALWVNGSNPRTPHARMLGSLFGALSWGQVSWLFAEGTYGLTGTLGTAMGVYGLLAVSDLFGIFRAAHDARYQHS